MIKYEKVTKKFKRTNTLALDEITFTVDDNEVACLLGPNGAGKTTLIKCLAGLIIFDSGSIYINDVKIHKGKNPYNNKTEIILDGARNIYWRVKVKSNFYYFGALKGKSRKEINESINKYDEKFKIKHLLDRRVSDLSLGQKQKVAILSSILSQPKVLILDEPSNGLDIDAKNELIDLLLLIKKDLKISILITSHDLEFTQKICDKYIFINNGRTIGEMVNKDLSLQDIENQYLQMINVGGNNI